jgi:hypothetical protein
MNKLSLVLLASTMILTELASAQQVDIYSGIEPKPASATERIEAFIDILVSNSANYNQTNTIELRLTENVIQVDFASDSFNNTYDQLGNDSWGGSIQVSDTSFQSTAEYCFDVTGVLSYSGQNPLSLDDDGCLPPEVVPAPPAPGFTIEWEYCLGLTAVYALDWWAAPGTVAPATFHLEQRVNYVWMPAYSGSATHKTFACPSRTYFRVKTTNAGGSSPWTYRWANHDCGGGGLPD